MKHFVSFVVFAMASLVVSMPVAFAAEFALTYDANGNLVTGDGKYRTYNSLNQLWKVYNGSNSSGTLLESYAHHPSEERVWLKQVYNSSGSVKEITYYFSKEHVRIVNSSGTYDQYFIYQEGNLVAQKNADGSIYSFNSDIKGSVVAVTNSSGSMIENSSYDALGNILSGTTKTRRSYEGTESDSLIGSADFNARRYNPSLGIFEAPDSLISNVYDSQSLNRYMFERGSPLNKEDPTGHFYWLIPVALAIGVYYLEDNFPIIVDHVLQDLIWVGGRGIAANIGEKIGDPTTKTPPYVKPAPPSSVVGPGVVQCADGKNCHIEKAERKVDQPTAGPSTKNPALEANNVCSVTQQSYSAPANPRVGDRVTSKSGKTGTYHGHGLTLYDSRAKPRTYIIYH